MCTEFKLNEKEAELAREFEEEHLRCERKYPTAIGGAISYEFTPTSIGTAVTIKCSICGEQKNITDYQCW